MSILLGMLFSGCGRSWSGGVIDVPGKYLVDSSKIEIEVHIDDRDFVVYTVADARGNELIESTDHASAFHRWSLFWDERKEALWFNSSDIGLSVWRKGGDGQYAVSHVRPDSTQLIKEIPNPVFETLPSSIQRSWESYR